MQKTPIVPCVFAMFVIGLIPIQRASASPFVEVGGTPLHIPFAQCAGTAFEAIQKSGLKRPTKTTDGAGGTGPTATGMIQCVRLPGAGPCKGDGASVVFAAASDTSADEARMLVQRMHSALGNPSMFDCN